MKHCTLGDRVFAGAFGSLLLAGVVASSTVISAAPARESAILGDSVALGEEVFFIEIKPSERRPSEFVGGFGVFRRVLERRGVALDEIWAGETRMYLKARFPAATGVERSALIDALAGHEFVQQVISRAAAPSVLRDIEKLDRFDSRTSIADARLRGLRQKRRGHQPNLEVPNTGEIIVKYLEAETDTPAKLAAARGRVAALHARTSARVERQLESQRGTAELLSLPPGTDLAKVLESYLASEDVEYAQPNYLYEPTQIPNDPRYPLQWAMPKISAPAAWDTRTDASNVVVAVIDTGIDYTHPDLAENMWVNPSVGALGPHDGLHGADVYNHDPDPMDDHYHGTHCAGIAGARANNLTGVAGVAWHMKLMAVKALTSSGGSSLNVADGIDYARLKGAQIVSASLGMRSGLLPDDDYLEQALARLRDAGAVFVNAAGNSNANCDAALTFPGNYGMPNFVVVGNSTSSDVRNGSSNYGRWSVDAFAPGTSIYSTLPGQTYGYLTGTSMSCPHVAGMLALAKAEFPWETATELADRARFSVDPISQLDALSISGGRINAAAALRPRPRFGNASTRCQVNTGDQIAIDGLTVSGLNPKRVAFRTIGPALGNWGVPGALPNPQISIYNSSSQLIGSNDDWGTLSAADRAELAAHGLTPFHALDSAWIATLAPGIYTACLSGVGGVTGISLIESFDIDGSTANRLVDVSTRCYVGTGDGIAIGGLVVNGTSPRQVYIRAWGPSLGSFGVPGALQDTVITLYNSIGTAIATNDDWQTFDGWSSALENRLMQAGISPFDARESAIVMRLAPGTYTVHLTGKNGGTGIGMIEFYEF